MSNLYSTLDIITIVENRKKSYRKSKNNHYCYAYELAYTNEGFTRIHANCQTCPSFELCVWNKMIMGGQLVR